MANTLNPVVSPSPAPNQGTDQDWAPGPEYCEGILPLLRDAKAGKRTMLDLFTEEERTTLLTDVDR